MIGILKKNAGFYLMYGIFLLIMSVVMWYSAMDRLRTPIAVINSFFMFFIVVIPALSAEALEEKHRGYPFLATLPLKLETVIRAKMTLPVMAVTVTVIFNLVFFQFFESSPSVLADCVKIILLNASIVIMLAGTVFLLMYRYNVRMLMMFLVFAGVFFNFLGLIAVRTSGIGNIFEWPEMVVAGKPTWIFIVMIFVGLGVYHLIFRRAIRLKEERLFD
ncbi:MAG: ABC-2 transporter permease [Candidatus Krumholzibacteria bacterium]|nr:ABC-2 transporter permease [Candidatus Krumholzibacteria bacterium]